MNSHQRRTDDTDITPERDVPPDRFAGTWVAHWFWTLPIMAALAVTAVILTAVGSDRDVESLGVFVLKLLPYLLATLGIATFPRHAPAPVRTAFAFAGIVPFFLYFIPRQFQLVREAIRTGYVTGAELGPSDQPFATAPQLEVPFDEFYIITQAMVPFVFLMVVAAFRFGGGSFGSTVKLALAAILFMVSGAEDVMYFVVNDLPLPDEFPWVSHARVRLGRVPSRTDLFALIAVHFALIAVVAALPINRWADRLRAGNGRPAG